MIKTNALTWRERIVRTNLTAATTRYFSLLCVSNKTLSTTLLRRKLHLQNEKENPQTVLQEQQELTQGDRTTGYRTLLNSIRMVQNTKTQQFTDV